MADNATVIYWDASAILSVLFTDVHSEAAIKWAETEGLHIISTLSYAEVCSGIARMKKERIVSSPLVKACFETLENGPWRYSTAFPDRQIIEGLSQKWGLRGADLWHLAAAKSLQRDLHELSLLTFDKPLRRAAQGADLLPS